MYCSKCGSFVQSTDSFCGKCGAPVSAIPDKPKMQPVIDKPMAPPPLPPMANPVQINRPQQPVKTPLKPYPSQKLSQKDEIKKRKEELPPVLSKTKSIAMAVSGIIIIAGLVLMRFMV